MSEVNQWFISCLQLLESFFISGGKNISAKLSSVLIRKAYIVFLYYWDSSVKHNLAHIFQGILRSCSWLPKTVSRSATPGVVVVEAASATFVGGCGVTLQSRFCVVTGVLRVQREEMSVLQAERRVCRKYHISTEVNHIFKIFR